MNFKLNNSRDKKLIERLNSYQFKLSQEIFGKRISLNLDRDEAARLTGLSLKQYTAFEQGIDMTSSQDDYRRVLNRLTNLQSNDIEIKNSTDSLPNKLNTSFSEFPVKVTLVGEFV